MLYVLKLEAATQASRKDRHSIRGAREFRTKRNVTSSAGDAVKRDSSEETVSEQGRKRTLSLLRKIAENRKFRFSLIDYPDADSLKPGVLIAASVVDLCNSVIPVRTANIRDKTRTIQEGEEEVEKLIKDMNENDVIEPSSSPWASPIVLVKKKDCSTRFCVDYRRLNDVTKKNIYPVPMIDYTLDKLSGNTWFSTLDLKSGYWKLELHPDDKEKTAFITGQVLWQFKVTPFGWCNAPATFERLMETVIGGLSYEACLVYLEDIIIAWRVP
ncbi:hypothetical protein TNCV_3000561 [Trichonephila clavipes]|nr:hypothetical protein TNCV_3000561 [Trichonephila clavipes]